MLDGSGMSLHQLYHHPDRPEITNRDLAEFLLIIGEQIMDQLAQLKAAVAAEDTVIASAVTLINGIAQRIADAGTNQADLDALVADVQSQAASLAAAVTANTPATGS